MANSLTGIGPTTRWVWHVGGAVLVLHDCLLMQVLDEVEGGYRLEIPKVPTQSR